MSLGLKEKIRADRRRIHELLRPNEPFIAAKPPEPATYERFMAGNDPVEVNGVAINSRERAQWYLEGVGLPLGEDGLPVPESGPEAERKLERASAYIDRSGDLIYAPPRARDCFGLPRFAQRPWKCDRCRLRQACHAVVDARLTFGGRQQFDELRDENGRFNRANAGVLGAISILRGWEPQLHDWRLHRDMQSRSRWRENAAAIDAERRIATRLEQEKRKEAHQALLAKALDQAEAEFDDQKIAPKLAQLASSDWVRDASVRRALTDQSDRTGAVWKAERAALLAGDAPERRGFVAEVVRLYTTISGDDRVQASRRSTVASALKVLKTLREAGEDV